MGHKRISSIRTRFVLPPRGNKFPSGRTRVRSGKSRNDPSSSLFLISVFGMLVLNPFRVLLSIR
ncbi:hypothetical protein CH367_03550 [Leptospira barantonii]|uniref:Uncharacterized protein n=1 Tax=Leptospira barantonii TaxID=2023184 RepID=A0ABX4NTN7_9LEPT|nr:hypothetical protein CH367_03550 [Leptospira barantonii]